MLNLVMWLAWVNEVSVITKQAKASLLRLSFYEEVPISQVENQHRRKSFCLCIFHVLNLFLPETPAPTSLFKAFEWD